MQANIVHMILQQQSNDHLISAFQIQRESLAQEIAVYVPSFKPEEQIAVHAQWAHLKGQLSKVDELLHYLTVPYAAPEPTLEDE